jgi:hypothetical protein
MYHPHELVPPPPLAAREDLESSDSEDEPGGGEAGEARAANAEDAVVQHINATIDGWEQMQHHVLKTHEVIDKFPPEYSNLIRIIMRERQQARRAQRRYGSRAEREDRVWLAKIMVRKDLGDDLGRKVLSSEKFEWDGKDPAQDATVGLLEICHPMAGFGREIPLILWRNDRFKHFNRFHYFGVKETNNINGLNQLMSEGRVYSGPGFTKWVKLEKNDTDMLLTACGHKEYKKEIMRDEFLDHGWLDFMDPAEFRTNYRVFQEYLPNDATMFDADAELAARFFPRAGDKMDGPVMHDVTDGDDDDESDGDGMQGGLKCKRKQSKRAQSKRNQSKRKQSKRNQSKRNQSKRKQSKRKQSNKSH